MKPISTNFTKEEGHIVGLDKMALWDFIKQSYAYCKQGKHYCFTVQEMSASQVHQNYYRANLALIAEGIGMTPRAVERNIMSRIYDFAITDESPKFPKSDWIIEIPDFETGDVRTELQGFSDWTTSMMNNYLEYLEVVAISLMPNFKMLDPKSYGRKIKGQKRQLKHPELKLPVPI